MFSTLRTRFGIPGVISVIALVFAMLGGAYAANNPSDGGKATASAKAKKGPRGPKGATGPAGPQGPVGPQGPAGAKGDAGANGTNGTNGTNGASAEAISFAGAKGGCTEGGVEVKSAKPATFVCNGKKGENGQTGFTETLPPGKTETGTWNATLTATAAVSSSSLASISFPIPLEFGGDAFVFTEEEVEEEEFRETGCSGSFELPVAPPGVLCVFTSSEQGFDHVSGTLLARSVSGHAAAFGPTGAVLFGLTLTGTPEAPASMGYSGSWAVTAPTEP